MKKILFLFFILSTSQVFAFHNVYQQNNVMLFVSLGMPKLTLRQYVIQSKKYHIPLILRGFLQNNYPETAKRIYRILHPKNKKTIQGGFEVDPLYFEKFNVTAVPALVVSSDHHYEIVYGNVPISKMLSVIAQRTNNHEIRSIADQKLENKSA